MGVTIGSAAIPKVIKQSSFSSALFLLLGFCLLMQTEVKPQSMEEVYRQQQSNQTSAKERAERNCRYIKSGIPIWEEGKKGGADYNISGYLIKWNGKTAIGSCVYAGTYNFVEGPIIPGRQYKNRVNLANGRFFVATYMWRIEGDQIALYTNYSYEKEVRRRVWGEI